MHRFAYLLFVLLAADAWAQDPWQGQRRGSWVEQGPTQAGDLVLRSAPNIVVARGEGSNVREAAECLAGDLEKIMGARPVIGPAANGPSITISTKRNDKRWEAYSVSIDASGIKIQGSNPRGTAFGVYELCERIGVDPLYLWTGFTPERHSRLVLKPIIFEQGPPDVRYRGLFHDDEDILPRPKGPDGIPLREGLVPKEWYERYFETALRLRMNMVAPWVRVQKPFEIQKMASDWGLYYTSHHYDTLLSDPYHFAKGLAAKRGAKPIWDWVANRDGMIKFWQGGVDENKNLDCIWPVGMRGTDDYSYRFPATWTEAQRIQAYSDAIKLQTELVKRAIPGNRERLFHFTMYTEMLPFFQTGQLKVPDDVIIVWPDDNDGNMRGLPAEKGTHKHGVYYHLAYFGRDITKQTHQTVPLERIEAEFRKIFAAGATEYCLVNVSELREYVLGVRFIADIQWNGQQGFGEPNLASRYLNWWCREYFGEKAAPEAAQSYRQYFALLPRADSLGYGANKCLGAISSLEKKLRGEPFAPAMPETLPTLRNRAGMQVRLLQTVLQAEKSMSAEQATFFFENLELPAAIDRLTTDAAIKLVEAMDEPNERALIQCNRALVPLDLLEQDLRRAERWPFDGWYGPSWIGPRNRTLVEPRRDLIKLLAAHTL